MRINDEFEAREVTVVRLYRNGQLITDPYGQAMHYPSMDAAIQTALDWDIHRAPTFDELTRMSDEELRSRAHGG